MRIETKEIRGLPLYLQEQMGVALVAQMEQANPVAGNEKRPREKTPVRRLRFRTARAAQRYQKLRILARTGIIIDLVLSTDGEYVRSFTYLVEEEV